MCCPLPAVGWYRAGMQCALGISPHTGWAACVVAGGSLRNPQILASEVVEILADPERFCYHRAAEMKRDEAREWIARARTKAIANAKRVLTPLMARTVSACAIVAHAREAQWDLEEILGSHSRIHMAEGCFYRDVLRAACTVPIYIVQPSSLDPSRVGRLAPPPWGRDQKLAALAAWTVVRNSVY
jgi:hypothetical protein